MLLDPQLEYFDDPQKNSFLQSELKNHRNENSNQLVSHLYLKKAVLESLIYSYP